jgi:hypothetical protein
MTMLLTSLLPGSPRKALAWFAMLAVALSGFGCHPTASWLPDSSGFVYIDGSRQLVLYDLARRRRVLADNLHCDRPALSPDGKQIAAAIHGKGGGWHVVIYDREGKELQRSLGKVEVDPPKDAFVSPPLLYWAPKENKVLIVEVYRRAAAIYDVNKNSLKQVPGDCGYPLAIEGTPICPDSKGFLTYTWDGNVAVMDWNGKSQVIRVNEDLRKLLGEADRGSMSEFPYFHCSRWEGDVASVSDSVVSLRFDTKKLEATGRVLPLPLTNDKEPIRHQHEFPDGAKVRLVQLQDSKSRLELLKPGEKEFRVLVSRCRTAQFLPSPDKKFLLLDCTQLAHRSLIVVDAKGTIVTDVEAKGK